MLMCAIRMRDKISSLLCTGVLAYCDRYCIGCLVVKWSNFGNKVIKTLSFHIFFFSNVFCYFICLPFVFVQCTKCREHLPVSATFCPNQMPIRSSKVSKMFKNLIFQDHSLLRDYWSRKVNQKPRCWDHQIYTNYDKVSIYLGRRWKPRKNRLGLCYVQSWTLGPQPHHNWLC